MLNEFNEEIKSLLSTSSVLTEILPLLRNHFQQLLANNEFKLACIDEIISGIYLAKSERLEWVSPAIIECPELNYSIRVVYWPAFYENNPHKHKTWSVTGVFHNKLNVHTYALLEDPIRLKRERIIAANAGESGYLLPGCIHSVGNPSYEVSASIHIFNNLPGIENSEDNAIWYPSPRKHNLANGLLERAFSVCLSMLSEIGSPKALDLIDKIYFIAPMQTKLCALNNLINTHPDYAILKIKELEMDLNKKITRCA
ncbi:MAG: hypothetical protein WA253_09420 [Gammaproteobacteria bacterium]